ncbi:hypothetical protein EJV47_16325 [Hymenobacter gummosus]|uniref:Carboxypeptidase regulatory-like domain-containing protein n=1 Tax=Hymenobacter gummosus TaxID=1776032 RepID=A0A3S0K475_9BACT|nr:hypothetical protein [Hymenobacter gummosus]RTQ48537.1 hypothetical protein EJV47_16325 [Hymenobacter gummosus]
MKRLLAPASLLAALAAPLTATAAPAEPPASVQALDHENIRVRIDNPARLSGRVQVVRLSNGQPLFDEAFAAEAYGHRFNFRDLPAGRYALTMTVGAQTYRYTMEVAAAGQPVAIRTIKVRLPKTAALTAAL